MKNQPQHINGKFTGKLIRAGLATALLLLTISSRAQLNPFQAMYFQNPYQYNPAMAGLYKGLNINIGYRQQWSNFPGAPKTGSFTADLQPTEKVGLGINVNDEQAGLIRTTRVMGTYAYHLPLNGRDETLSFGLSLGVNDSRVNYDNINGDQSDQEVAQYNQLKPYVDGDFGIAYTSDNLSVGGVLPNLKSAFFKTSDSRFDADRMVFIATTSYKLPIQGDGKGFLLEPLAAYRVVKGYKDIIDGGFNFTLNDYGLYFQGIYHSSQSMGLGAGLDQQTYVLSFSYNLETGQLASFTHGAFEFGLKLRLFGK
jgi:type IX secretion system PorP/SprF family membrane protein